MATPRTDAFLVGWIAALSHELGAARSVLDEEFSEPPPDFMPPMSDTNTYTWGRVGKHNVVVTSLPMGVYGLSAAAEVASRLSGSLPKLRFGLMVGIGAGIVAGGEDIRLGDVVVSKPTGTTGGVVQYDSLKAKVDNGERRDERIGHLANPPRVLLSALAKWESSYWLDGSMVPDIMSAVFERKPRMRRTFGYPVSLEGDTRRESPEIHLGVIASGHKLIKPAEERDRILQWLSKENIHPLCFEMEAAGLIDAFPCLVIRGICDYADENKNDDWQRYAALTAACFAKEPLQQIDATTMEREENLAQRLKTVENSVKQIQHDAAIVSKHAVTEEFDAFLNWVSPEDYSGRLHDEKRRHQKGTAQWVLDDPKYQAWVCDQESSATRELFCHGRQGTGKTTIAAVIIQDLLDGSDDQDYAVMYVFFNHKQHGIQNYEHVLATLLRQLLHARNNSADVATRMHAKHTEHNTRPTLEELEEALQGTLTSVASAFVVLDALDECHTNVARLMFERLVPIMKACQVRLLATARQIPAIEARFAEAQKIQIEASSEDLALYAGEEMKVKLPVHLASNTSLTERIVQHVVQNCAGIFLIAQLVMESIVLLDTVADVQRCLEAIPYGEDGLKYLHEKALERIQGLRRSSQTDRALEALVWIVYSKRILGYEELEHALAFGPDDTTLNFDAIAPADIIVDQCAGLIRMDEESGTVGVIHQTTQRYLEEYLPGFLTYKPHALLACKCIAYVTLDGVGNTQTLIEYSLYSYAIRMWTYHAEEVEQQSDQKEFDHFFSQFRRIEQATPALSFTVEERSLAYNPDSRTDMSGTMNIWHALAVGNLARTCQLLMRFANYSNAADSQGRNPMHWAALYGNVEVAALLLNCGRSDVTTYDDYQRSPLSYAVNTGNTQMVTLFVQGGNLQQQYWRDSNYSDVYLAASNGDAEIVDVLLKAIKRTVNIIRPDEQLREAALAATRATEDSGCTAHDAVVFDQPANEALRVAARHGHDGVLDILIAAHDVDLNSADQFGDTGLHKAASNGRESTVRLLLSQQAVDVNLRNEKDSTRLHETLYALVPSFENEESKTRYHRAIVALLTSEGIDVCIRNAAGETALSLAAAIRDGVAWNAIAAVLKDSPLRLQESIQYAYVLHVIRQRALQQELSQHSLGKGTPKDLDAACHGGGEFIYDTRLITESCKAMKQLKAMSASDARALLLYMSDLVRCRSCGRPALHQGYHCRVCVDSRRNLERTISEFGRDDFMLAGQYYESALEFCGASNVCSDCASRGCLTESTTVYLERSPIQSERQILDTRQCGIQSNHLLQWIDSEPLLENRVDDFVAPYEVAPLKISRSESDVQAWKARLEVIDEEERRKMDVKYEEFKRNPGEDRRLHTWKYFQRSRRRCGFLRCEREDGKHSPWCLQIIDDQNPGASSSAESQSQEHSDLSDSSEEYFPDLWSSSEEDSELSS